MKQLQLQQGDVWLEKTSIPSRALKVTGSSRIVLAEGEATGHAHAIVNDNVTEYVYAGRRFLRVVDRPATLVHEEHLPITLEPGDYEFGSIHEFDPFNQQTRTVID